MKEWEQRERTVYDIWGTPRLAWLEFILRDEKMGDKCRELLPSAKFWLYYNILAMKIKTG